MEWIIVSQRGEGRKGGEVESEKAGTRPRNKKTADTERGPQECDSGIIFQMLGRLIKRYRPQLTCAQGQR